MCATSLHFPFDIPLWLGKAPGKFYDAAYAIPTALTEGHSKVNVKLQAHPHNTAGGLFGVRVLKAEPGEVEN